MFRCSRVARKVLAVCCALAFAAPAAQAQDDSAGLVTCVFSGVASNTPKNDIASDLLEDVSQLSVDTESGTFNFSGSANCSGADIAGSSTPVGAAQTYTLTAAGSFTSLYCGTGTANGTANLFQNPDTNLDLSFGITFAAGQGSMGVIVDGGVWEGQSVDGGNGDGAVSILPQNGNCVTTDTSSFTVNGAFATTIFGD